MERIDFIRATVREAGAMLMNRRDTLHVSTKDGDPKNIVTDADHEIDAFITNAIAQSFPGERVYSEEGEHSFAREGVQWIIDPIDGTSNFSRGIPHFAAVLGVVEDGIPTAGAIFNPATNELFSFEKGKGAFLNEKTIHVSPIKELSKAFTLLHAGRKPELQEWGGTSYSKLLGAARKTSNLSCLGLDTCFVAAGRVEVSVYGTFSALDAAPALGILAEAGGVATRKDGGAIAFSSDVQPVIIANNQAMADSVRTLLFN